MTYAVELIFDPESSSRLRALWASLQEIYGAPRHSELGVEPHLALAVFRGGEPSRAEELVERFARTVAPFEIDLVSVETFPTAEGVVYLRAAPCPALLQAHALLHRELRETASRCLEYYRPGAWIPHCTVATDVPAHCTEEVVDDCMRSGALGPVQVQRVGGVQYRPARYRHSFPLTG